MTTKMVATSWHERAASLQMDGRAFIGGQRVWAKNEQQFENLSPIDGRKPVSYTHLTLPTKA